MRFNNFNLFGNIADWIEYKDVPISELQIIINSFRIPKGRARLRITPNNLQNKRSIITIKNTRYHVYGTGISYCPRQTKSTQKIDKK